MKKLFNNSGVKIQKFAKVFFIICIVIAILYAIGCIITGASFMQKYGSYADYKMYFGGSYSTYKNEYEVYRTVGLSLMIAGPISAAIMLVLSWISCLFLYSYGDMVENVSLIKAQIAEKTDFNERIQENDTANKANQTAENYTDLPSL